MAYMNRIIEKTILDASKSFACITIYGPRQVGKSTTINWLFKNKIKSVTLDNFETREAATNNPRQFLESLGWPLIIDEIQKVPQLLNQIKIIIDEEKYRRLVNNEDNEVMYILTGSNRFELQKYVTESLAGRTAIIEMNSLTNTEKHNASSHLFNPNYKQLIENSKQSTLTYKTVKEIFEDIFNGGMPEYIDKKILREMFFNSYIETYIEKDVKNAIGANMEFAFRKFLSILALRTGTQINYQDIASKVGIDVKTVKNWLSILKATNLITFLYPYMSNLSDRIIKSPKLYFMDTGLCSYLCGWQNAEMLENGIMSGAFFETYVVTDIIKNMQAHCVNPDNYLYYYRDIDQKEVDLLYVDVNGITPIEIKKSTSPSNPTKNFDALKKYKTQILPGLIIDNCAEITPHNDKAWFYPSWRLGE